MKQYRYLFSILLVVSLSIMQSCSMEQEIDTNGGSHSNTKEENAFLSIKVGTLNNERTYSPSEDEGEEIERAVNNIRVVLYELEENSVAYCWDLDATNLEQPGNYHNITNFHGKDVSSVKTPTEYGFVSVAKNIKPQDYKVLVILNPSQRIKSITEEGRFIFDIERDETLFADEVSGDGINTYFQMTNHKGLIDISPEKHIKYNSSEALKNPVHIPVERAVAKILVDGHNIQVPGNNSFYELYWVPDITNKKTYWIRRPSSKTGREEELPGDQDRENFYAKDPNFIGQSVHNATNEYDAAILKDQLQYEFNYLSEFPDYRYAHCLIDGIYPTGYASTAEYVLENTMEAEEQRRDVTTRIVLSGRYMLDGLSPGNLHFYAFMGIPVKKEDMIVYAENPSLIPSTLDGLKSIIEQMRSEGFDFHNYTWPSFVRPDGLNFYSDGICYYTIYLRHFNDDQEPTYMEYGRYGVVRNNIYSINIKSVSGPGYPLFPEATSEPDDLESYIEADILVEPWKDHYLDFEL